MYMGWGLLDGLTPPPIISVVHLLILDKVFLVGEESQLFWLLWMFQFISVTLGSGYSVLGGFLEYELISSYHVQLVTELFMNHALYGGLINLQLPDQCTYGLPRFLGIQFLDRTDEFRFSDNVRVPEMLCR